MMNRRSRSRLPAVAATRILPLLAALLFTSAHTTSAETPARPDAAARLSPLDRWKAQGSEFTIVSGPASPGVAYALARNGSDLELVVEAEAHGQEVATLQVGLAALRKRILTGADARTSRLPDAVRFSFKVPVKDLIDRDTDWSRLRFGLAVAWKQGPGLPDRERERFLHTDRRAPFAGMSASEKDWASLGLA